MSDAYSQAADDRDEDEEAAQKMYGHLGDDELRAQAAEASADLKRLYRERSEINAAITNASARLAAVNMLLARRGV